MKGRCCIQTKQKIGWPALLSPLRILFLTLFLSSQSISVSADTQRSAWTVVEDHTCSVSPNADALDVDFLNVTHEAHETWSAHSETTGIHLLQSAEIYFFHNTGETEAELSSLLHLRDQDGNCQFAIELRPQLSKEYKELPSFSVVHGALIGDFDNDYRYILADVLRRYLCNSHDNEFDGVTILTADGASFDTTPWIEPLRPQDLAQHEISSCTDMARFLQAYGSAYWFVDGPQSGVRRVPEFATVASNIVVDFRMYTPPESSGFDPNLLSFGTNYRD